MHVCSTIDQSTESYGNNIACYQIEITLILKLNTKVETIIMMIDAYRLNSKQDW